VRQAEQRVEDYKKANNLLSSSGTLVNERQLTELNSQLILARSRSAEARARYEKIAEAQKNRADPGAIGEAVGSATITALRTQLAEIARKEGEINATLGSRHPAVIEIASQAQRIRRMIEEEVARIAEATRNDMERAQANEASLSASLERLKDELEGTNSAGVKLRELERDVQASRSVYEAFLVRTREVSEQERLDTTNIRVIASPDLPENRSFPPRTLLLLAGGAVLGGMLGVALAFFGEWRDRRRPVLAVVTPDAGSAAVIAPVTVPAPYVPAAPVAAPPRQPSPPVAPDHAREPYAPRPQAAAAPRKQAFRL
jgi:succinoglycan biosynthesis transport protein ExoP